MRLKSTTQHPATAIQNDRQLWQLNGLKSGRLKLIRALAIPIGIVISNM
jgi:hypothetical protein